MPIDSASETKIPSWVPIVIALGSFLFAINVHYQLLPLRQARVIFSEENLRISQDKCPDGQNECDYIVPTISNIGEAEARNVKFSSYVVPFDEIIFQSFSQKKFFDDEVVHNLYPGSQSRFGVIHIGHKLYDCQGNIIADNTKKEVALIYKISYEDSLSNKIENRYFLFHYLIGGKEAFSLIEDDLSKIKVKIEKEIKDEDFLKFIESK